jgi:competence protein ComEA
MKVKKTFLVVLSIFMISSFFVCTAAQATSAKKASSLEGKININTATLKQFTLLEGIGKKTAESIVDYRTKNGNFKSADGLSKIKGIGKQTLKKNNSYLTIKGETTLRKVKK